MHFGSNVLPESGKRIDIAAVTGRFHNLAKLESRLQLKFGEKVHTVEKLSEAVVNELRKSVLGEVRVDNLNRQLYSTDASDYRKVPLGVVIPRSSDDIQAAVEIADRFSVPVIPRGGGSSVSGQTVGTGIVIDHSKYLNRILQVNAEEKWVEVESGVVLDALNLVLAPKGLMVGPDPSSSAVATIGGMTGNNSTGSHSFVHGMMADHIDALEVVLSDGSKAMLNPKSDSEVNALSAGNTLEGRLYRRIPKLLQEYADLIRSGYPRTWRNVAGYGLDRLLNDRQSGKLFSLAPLVVGSEGTLAAITRIRLRLVARPRHTRLMILHFEDLQSALQQVEPILEHEVTAVELMAYQTLKLAHDHPVLGTRLRQFVQGLPGAVLIVEFAGSSVTQLAERAAKLEKQLRQNGHGQPVSHCETPEQVANVWHIRKSVFGLIVSKPGDDKPVWMIDDASVPVSEMVNYTREVIEAGRQFGVEISFDAHASAGCLHMGLNLNLKTRHGLRTMEQLSREIMAIVIAHHGSTTGEHGEGLARSYFNKQLYGARLHQAFREVKSLFDPKSLLNPRKVVDPIEPWDKAWLKIHPEYHTPYAPVRTHLDFAHYGGFAGLVEMCNGQGTCRSQVSGTMCPSYKVTRDERDTPRGRANALRAAMAGQFGAEGLVNRAVYDALDLCLECKACRNECSTGVDMAKLKYEFLAIYQEHHGVPIRKRIFGHLADTSRVASLFPAAANYLFGSKVLKTFLDRFVNIDARRELPKIAPQTFQNWFRNRHRTAAPARGPLVFWDDCYISYNQPDIGRAAVRILEAMGYEVICLEGRRCCGRPMISKGLLKEAKEHAHHNVNLLMEYVRKGIPIVGLEPSCIACFRDEYPDLLRSQDARRVAGQSFFFEEFLVDPKRKASLRPLLSPNGARRKILVHTHCYQKAMGISGHVLELLRLLPDADVEEIPSGCCGMAGSFGYEKEHYDVSMAIGEQVLFPTIRAAAPGTIISAAGISCRTQIKDGTKITACHPIEIIADAISPGERTDSVMAKKKLLGKERE